MNAQIKKGLLYIDGKQVPFKQSPNVGGVCKPEILIMHDTASGLVMQGSIDWLCNPQAKASAHFVVGRKGEITQLVSTDQTAWHAGKSTYKGRAVNGSVNSFSTGIEIINPGVMTTVKDGRAFFYTGKVSWDIEEYKIKKAKPLPLDNRAEVWWMSYTDEQIEACLLIGKAIKEAYQIKDVVAHWSVSPGRKVDTNPLFPLDAVKDSILKGSDMANHTTKTVRANTSAADKEKIAKAELDKSKGQNASVTITEKGKGTDATENLSPNTIKAGTPLDSVAASKVAPTDMANVDPGVAPIIAPVDPTPQAPDPLTPNEQEIDKSRGKLVDKEEARASLTKGLVTQNLNIRAWPDSPTVVAVLRVGAYVDIERETTSQVTGSKWYAIRALPATLSGYLGKAKVIEGFVHSAYIQK